MVKETVIAHSHASGFGRYEYHASPLALRRTLLVLNHDFIS